MEITRQSSEKTRIYLNEAAEERKKGEEGRRKRNQRNERH